MWSPAANPPSLDRCRWSIIPPLGLNRGHALALRQVVEGASLHSEAARAAWAHQRLKAVVAALSRPPHEEPLFIGAC